MNKKIRTISILGCGWLGLPLAERLIAEGFRVKGSTVHPAKLKLLQSRGIESFTLKIHPKSIEGSRDFFASDLLIINFPPQGIEGIEDLYPAQLEICLRHALEKSCPYILFISSTSVYPNHNQLVTEEDAAPEKASGIALLKAEDLLRETHHIAYCIIRFGGLIGPGRDPITSLLKKRKIIAGNAPLNLIHIEDCIGIILEIIRQGAWNMVFNACAPQHPLRKDYYERSAKILNLPLPEFNDTEKKGFKIVSTALLQKKLHYTFLFPDPIYQ